MKKDNNEIYTWILPKPINNYTKYDLCINDTLQKVLIRRGITIEEDMKEFLTPSNLPNPNEHFSQLNKATNRIIEACNRNEKIAICGDYDADGITSTILLLELLSNLGAKAISYIPSRQDDGYGLNTKMVNDIHIKDIKLIITVDNGISAFDAIKRSKELCLDLIITDHHKIPNYNIEIFALIHPELSPINSPYKSLAGVGIAFLLAKNICDKLNYNIDLTIANVLFCIGTVADMAPLVGANRKWLKECLPKFHNSRNLAIRSIIKKLNIEDKNISSEDIGYKIAPLINAVGRIDNPKLIIDLLIYSSEDSIKKSINKCFTINKVRKNITINIEKEAYDIALNEYSNNSKFLVLTKREWHPGVIGIVAARMVDKFNLPTAILSLANDGTFRGSVRSNNKLKVNLALDECSELLISHGGHSAAAGFTIREENISELKDRLNHIATREFKSCNLVKSINPEAYICLKDINNDFLIQLNLIGPFGNKNPTPIFWTRKCRIVDLYRLKGNHIKFILDDGTASIEAVKWNTTKQLKIHDLIDIAFYIEFNKWKNVNKIQLNIQDIKIYNKTINLKIHNRDYECRVTEDMDIVITNNEGESISSNSSKNSYKTDMKKILFTKKLLSFAEIALGQTD